MSPAPSLFQLTLRAIVLRLVLLLDAALGVRAALLRARLRGLPAGHRRRRPIEAEVRRIYPNLFPRLPVSRAVATAPHAGPDRCTATSLSPVDRPARAAATWTRA